MSWRRRLLTRLLPIVLLSLGGVEAHAQSAPALRSGEITVAAGGVLAGGYAVGDRAAELRRNTTTAASLLPLFRAESAIERVGGLDVRVGVALTRRYAVEVGASYARPTLGVRITGDSEAGEPVSIAGELEQFGVEVSGSVQLPWRQFGRRARPYLVGGGGYLRQLLDGRVMAETGSTLHAGGGVRYWLRGGTGRGRSLGVRGEARYVRRSGGIEFADRGRAYPAASLLLFAGL